MISKRLFVWVVLPALLMGTAAHGWYINDFSDAVGLTDHDFKYTTAQGIFWDTWSSPVPGNSPWLSSRTSDLGTPTAWFYNAPDGVNARMRHFTEPDASDFNLSDGIAVEYRKRAGELSYVWRGQTAIRANTVAPDPAVHAGVYVRLRNHDFGDGRGTVGLFDICRENQSHSYHHDYTNYQHIEWLNLGYDMTDVWAEYRVEAIYNPDDTSEGYRWTWWKLYLDGQLLQFDGPSGGLQIGQWQGQDWSFRIREGMGSGGARLAMCNVISQDAWDFEFDYFNYVPEPASLLLLASGVLFLRRRRS